MIRLYCEKNTFSPKKLLYAGMQKSRFSTNKLRYFGDVKRQYG